MIRGTTAPFRIKLPYTIGELEWVTIQWWQDGNKGTTTAPLPITKKLVHCSMSNIYLCTLSSDIAVDEQCYFTIEGVAYGFTATQNITAGSILRYDAETTNLTVDTLIITPDIVDNSDGMIELTFVNESNNSNELYVVLTAEETMRFSDKHKAKMQLRARCLSNGRVFSHLPRIITVYPINDELFEDYIIPSDTGDDWIVLDGGSIIK